MIDPTITARVEFRAVSKIYKSRTAPWRKSAPAVAALSNIDFVVPVESSLAVVGESGAGKSTLAKLLLGLEPPTSGEIFVNGELLSRPGYLSPRLKEIRTWMQPVFQDPSDALNGRMRVGEIVSEPLLLNRRLGRNGNVQDAVDAVLHEVGLSGQYRRRYPHQLSGGQRQRVAIARALILKPSVLILDEPVSALDVSISAQILNLLRSLRQRLNVSYIFITHDLATVRYLADEIIVMRSGEIVEAGSATSVMQSPSAPYTRQLIQASTLEGLSRRGG